MVSLYIKDQVSNPYKTTGKIKFLYIVVFIFLDCKQEGKRFLLIPGAQSVLNFFKYATRCQNISTNTPGYLMTLFRCTGYKASTVVKKEDHAKI
jgi:hypothetical protein